MYVAERKAVIQRAKCLREESHIIILDRNHKAEWGGNMKVFFNTIQNEKQTQNLSFLNKCRNNQES